jgi:hypothetical protein
MLAVWAAHERSPSEQQYAWPAAQSGALQRAVGYRYEMVCPYCRAGPVSSEKPETAAEAGGVERRGDTSGVQEEHPAVHAWHLPRHWHVAPADQPDVGEGVMAGATRPGRDHRRPVACGKPSQHAAQNQPRRLK